ncbi:unnamed protein product [Sphagnum troendelagicum]
MFEILEYLKSLQPQNLQESTTNAGEDALERHEHVYSASTWCCRSSPAKGFLFDFFFAYVAKGSNGDNSSRIGKAFVLAHGGGLQHPQH